MFVPTASLRNRESFADAAADWAHFSIFAPPMTMLLYECFLCFLNLFWRLPSWVPQEALHILPSKIFADRLLIEHLDLLLLAPHWCKRSVGGDCDSHARRWAARVRHDGPMYVLHRVYLAGRGPIDSLKLRINFYFFAGLCWDDWLLLLDHFSFWFDYRCLRCVCICFKVLRQGVSVCNELSFPYVVIIRASV